MSPPFAVNCASGGALPRGRAEASSSDLFKKEAAIWGSTDTASQVRIHAEVTNPGAPIGPLAERCPRYALFPFSSQEQQEAIGGIHFSLSLDFPESCRDDVETAVNAWTNFGAVGSRTRRGCGALYCSQTAPPSPAGIPQWWRALLSQCGRDAQSQPAWAQLKSAPLWLDSGPSTQPIPAWCAAITTLAEFRQKELLGRNQGRTRRVKVGRRTGDMVYAPGRSRWPESDSLKAKTGAVDPDHATPASVTVPDPWERPAFPRAAFGLPIVFQFKPDPDEAANEGSLEPEGAERMASPVILRPWKMQNGRILSLALPLWAPPPGTLVYKFNRYREPANATRALQWTIPGGYQAWYGTDLETYPNSPMHNRNACGYSTLAFYDYLLREQHFQTVKP